MSLEQATTEMAQLTAAGIHPEVADEVAAQENRYLAAAVADTLHAGDQAVAARHITYGLGELMDPAKTPKHDEGARALRIAAALRVLNANGVVVDIRPRKLYGE